MISRRAIPLLTAQIRTTPFCVLVLYLFDGFHTKCGDLFIFFSDKVRIPFLLLALSHSAFIVSNGALQDLGVGAESVFSDFPLQV